MIGFPSLAATSMEQGRLAALAAFDRPAQSLGAILPYGIYSIPELSFVGPTERELTDDAVPYVVGVGRYRELARGEIAGDRTGLLKLLVHARTRKVLGVHIFGTSATELVHVGQTVIGRRADRRLPRRRGVQRADVLRRVQGGRARRGEPAERAGRRAGGRGRSPDSGLGARVFSRRGPVPTDERAGLTTTLYCSTIPCQPAPRFATELCRTSCQSMSGRSCGRAPARGPVSRACRNGHALNSPCRFSVPGGGIPTALP